MGWSGGGGGKGGGGGSGGYRPQGGGGGGHRQHFQPRRQPYQQPMNTSRQDVYLHDALNDAREMKAAFMMKEQERARKAERKSLASAIRASACEAVGSILGIDNKKVKKSIGKSKKDGNKKPFSFLQFAKGRVLKKQDSSSSTSSSAGSSASSCSSEKVDIAKMKKAFKKNIAKTNKEKHDEDDDDNGKDDKQRMAKLLKQMQEPSTTADLESIGSKDETIKMMMQKMDELQRKIDSGAGAASPARPKADGGARLRVPAAFQDRADGGEGDPEVSATSMTVAKQLPPETDLSDWPTTDKAFLKRLSEVPKITQTILNGWLRKQGLSESTGTSKLAKAEQLVNHLKTKEI